MKSEERHELKRNELAYWMEHAPELFKEHIWTIVGAALILTAVILYVFSRTGNKYERNTEYVGTTTLIESLENQKLSIIQNQQNQEGFSEEGLVVLADQLQTAAENVDNDNLSAFSYIKQGDALRMDLLFGSGAVEEDVVISQLDIAKKAYRKALDRAPKGSVAEAAAKLGLGLCAEDLGEFEEAKQLYREITSNESYAASVYPVEAQNRLDNLEDYSLEVQFAAAAVLPADIMDTDIKLPDDFETPADEMVEEASEQAQQNIDAEIDTSIQKPEIEIK